MNEPKLATTSEEPMPTVALDSPSAKVLADLGSVHQDLVFVTNCCERLLPLLEQEEKDAVLIQALWTAAVVAYTRCFVGDKRLGIGEDSFVGLEGDVVELHRLVLSMRNKHIAHSVNPFEVVRVGVVLSPQSSPVRKVKGIATLSMRHLAGDVLFVRQLASLAHTLRKRVAALGKEQERIVKEEAEQRDIDSLYRLPLMRTTAPDPEQAGRARRSTD